MTTHEKTGPVWKPSDQYQWDMQAYGKNVFYTSQGGVLVSQISSGFGAPCVYMHGFVVGRMLVEAYVNQQMISSDLISNRALTLDLNFSPDQMQQDTGLRIVFIPATWGQVSCARTIHTTPDAKYKFEVFNSMQVA